MRWESAPAAAAAADAATGGDGIQRSVLKTITTHVFTTFGKRTCADKLFASFVAVSSVREVVSNVSAGPVSKVRTVMNS